MPHGADLDWWPGRRPRSLSRSRKIQGILIVLIGYEIVVVAPRFSLTLRCEKPEGTSAEDWKKIVATLDLPCNYNIPKALISLVQAFWGIATIYKARGNQIDMYGYAAFGLTVVPYGIMSVTNLAAGLFRPGYPSLSLASSPDLVEALRGGGHFDCIVADIDENSPIVHTYTYEPPTYPLYPRNWIKAVSSDFNNVHKRSKRWASGLRIWLRIPIWILSYLVNCLDLCSSRY